MHVCLCVCAYVSGGLGRKKYSNKKTTTNQIASLCTYIFFSFRKRGNFFISIAWSDFSVLVFGGSTPFGCSCCIVYCWRWDGYKKQTNNKMKQNKNIIIREWLRIENPIAESAIVLGKLIVQKPFQHSTITKSTIYSIALAAANQFFLY